MRPGTDGIGGFPDAGKPSDMEIVSFPWQAQIRLSDRLVIQTGISLGDRDEPCVIIDLTDEQYAALQTALSVPNGGVLMAEDGTLTTLPPPPEMPPFPTFEERVAAEVARVLAARGLV